MKREICTGVARWFLVIVLVFVAHPARAGDAIQTKWGAPLKVVVRQDCALFSSADRSSRSKPVKKFDFFYALEVDEGEKLKDGFYLVSSTPVSSGRVGWIHQDDVVEWPHKQALGFRPQSHRERATFFRKLGDGNLVDPISREPAGSSVISLMPILDQRTIIYDGDEVSCYRVAYLHGRDPRQESGVTTEVIRKKMTLDIAFVIDATGSMQDEIDAVKEAVTDLSKEISDSMKGRIRLALVCYKDVSDEVPFKVFCSFEKGTSITAFLRELQDVEVGGGGDTPEQVFAAIEVAVEDLSWNEIGYRNIVLIGDASSKVGPDGQSLEGVLKRAQPDGAAAKYQSIAIHSLQVKSGDDEDGLICERQFKALAEGRAISGIYASFSDLADFKRRVLRMLSGGMEIVRDIKEGEFDAVVARSKVDRSLGAVLEMIETAEATDATAETNEFAEGFVSEVDGDGNRTVEPYILVRKASLESYNAAVNFIVTVLDDAGEPGSKNIESIMNRLKSLTAGINMGEPITEDIPLSKLLNLIGGFPVQNEIFEMSPRKLAAMPTSDYQSWTAKVRASHDIVKGHLDSDIWFKLGEVDRNEYLHSFLKIKDLP